MQHFVFTQLHSIWKQCVVFLEAAVAATAEWLKPQTVDMYCVVPSSMNTLIVITCNAMFLRQMAQVKNTK